MAEVVELAISIKIELAKRLATELPNVKTVVLSVTFVPSVTNVTLAEPTEMAEEFKVALTDELPIKAAEEFRTTFEPTEAEVALMPEAPTLIWPYPIQTFDIELPIETFDETTRLAVPDKFPPARAGVSNCRAEIVPFT